MSKMCKLFLMGLAICMFTTTLGTSKEHTSRSKMPAWKIRYWASDNVGLKFEEIRGKYGIIYLQVVSKGSPGAKTGEPLKDLQQWWRKTQDFAREHFIDRGLYFQIFTIETKVTHQSRKELETLVKALKIVLPVACVAENFWYECDLAGDEGEVPKARSAIFLLDPYGRIAARSPEDEIAHFQRFNIPPYEKMEREVSEYWLETKAGDLAKADKYFEKGKWPEAYKIYRPLAKVLVACEKGKVIGERVGQIEKRVQGEILDSLCSLSGENIKKIMTPLKKIQRSYKDTVIGRQVSRHLAVLKRAKKDPELLALIRMNTANTLSRIGQPEKAMAIYRELKEACAGNEKFICELDTRIEGKFKLKEEDHLDPGSAPGELLEKAEELFGQAEKLIDKGNISEPQRQEAVICLLSAAEHFTAIISCCSKEAPGLRARLATIRDKLFWIASQE
ncbi:hypothetical protein ACFL54_03285 [Planctomycetota bacterium]